LIDAAGNRNGPDSHLTRFPARINCKYRISLISADEQSMNIPAPRMKALLLLMVFAANTVMAAAEPADKPGCSRPILVAASPMGRSMIISTDGKVSGLTHDAFNLIAKDTGCTFEYVVVPRARAFLMLNDGEVDIVPEAIQTPARDAVARFVELGKVSPMLISLTKNTVDVASMNELIDSSLNLVTIIGQDYGPEYRALLSNPKMQGRIVKTVAPENAVKMLLAGRTDALLMSPTTIADAWERLGGGTNPVVQEVEGMPAQSFGHYISTAQKSGFDIDVLERGIVALIRRGDLQRLLKSNYPEWSIKPVKLIIKLRK